MKSTLQVHSKNVHKHKTKCATNQKAQYIFNKPLFTSIMLLLNMEPNTIGITSNYTVCV